jgi:hypothetical protein
LNYPIKNPAKAPPPSAWLKKYITYYTFNSHHIANIANNNHIGKMRLNPGVF